MASSIAKTKRDGLLILSGSGASDRLDVKYETGDFNLTIPGKTVNFFLDRGDFVTEGDTEPNLRYGDEQPMTFTFTGYVTELSASDGSTTLYDMIDGGTSGWTSTLGSGQSEFTVHTYWYMSGSNVGEDLERISMNDCSIDVSVAEGDPNLITISGMSHDAYPGRGLPAEDTQEISQFTANDRNLQYNPAVSDYSTLTGDSYLSDGAPVGRTVWRDQANTGSSPRPTVASSTDLRQYSLSMPPGANELGPNGYVSHLSCSDQHYYGPWLPSGSDFTLMLWNVPQQNGRYIAADPDPSPEPDQLVVEGYFSGGRYRVWTRVTGSLDVIMNSPSTDLSTGTEYVLAVTYDRSAGDFQLLAYNTDGTSIHSDTHSNTSDADLNFTGSQYFCGSPLQPPAGDLKRMMVFDEVLSSQNIVDNITSSIENVVGNLVRHYSGTYSGVSDPANTTRLLWATGSGAPVRFGSHPSGSVGKMISLSGESNADGDGTSVVPHTTRQIGRLNEDNAEQYEFEDEPGLERWMIGDDRTTDPLRGVLKYGVDANIQSHIDTHLPSLIQYALTASVTPAAHIFWHGEADSNAQGKADGYESKLSEYLENVDTAWGSPTIPKLVVELLVSQSVGGTNDYADTIRTAQATVAAASGSVYLISRDSVTTSDGEHADNAGMELVADRCLDLLTGSLGIW